LQGKDRFTVVIPLVAVLFRASFFTQRDRQGSG
jgi:hypothetical protein